MVRFTAAAVLAFAISTMALSTDDASYATGLQARQEAEAPKADSMDDFKKWMNEVAEVAKELQRMAEDVASKSSGQAN
ncbi:hypothetical protein V2A60_008281 [Cordyceps javanica]|uniref:Uncharacterized protein n=1 Tax=Cordyceps javanica TaxID=43265 RepID=A0A545UMC1_9HYPO|nr:hypothetical protein IF1G_10755 [Cordyceps javanica]TQW02050.1 hypothetical protein IF2G_10450 [Cordyceps javanica]